MWSKFIETEDIHLKNIGISFGYSDINRRGECVFDYLLNSNLTIHVIGEMTRLSQTELELTV